MMEQIEKQHFKRLLWGSASAAYQIEGACGRWKRNDKLGWVCQNSGKTYKETTGDAVDHYHRYKEDIRLMAEMDWKHTGFPFVGENFPKRKSAARSMKRIVFMGMWLMSAWKSLSQWWQSFTGICHRRLWIPVADGRARNYWRLCNLCKDIVPKLGDKVKYWITLNEQNIFTSLGWLSNIRRKIWRSEDVLSNHHAYGACKSLVLLIARWDTKVRSEQACIHTPSYALDCKPINAMCKSKWWFEKLLVDGCLCIWTISESATMTYLKKKKIAPQMQSGDEEILKEAAKEITFMGVNYYQSCVCEYNPLDGVTPWNNEQQEKGTAQESEFPEFKNPANHLMTTDWDWSIDPERTSILSRNHEPLCAADYHIRKWIGGIWN